MAQEPQGKFFDRVKSLDLYALLEVEPDVEMEEVEEEQEEDAQFPEGVIDIDALEDQNNPQLCVEYAPSIYAYLRKVEEGLSIRKEFLKG